MTKQDISKKMLIFPIGFLYWLQEYKDLRGLKGIDIGLYDHKINLLIKEYNTKYPDGLTGW